MAKTSTYWDKRAIKRMTEAEKQSEAYIKRIKKIYEQAYRDIDKDIRRVYKNYAKETGLDVDKLKELLTRSETKKTWEQMKRQGLDRFIKDNYKARISRLEQIQAQIYAKAKLIYPKEELEQTMAYEGIIHNSYYKAMYDTQMGTNLDFAFTKIDKNIVTSLLNERWSGKNYSQRIWTNTDILAESVSQLVGGAMLSGQSIEKTTRQLRERFNVGKYYAERLVRTETNYMHGQADMLAYEDMGIKEYVFVAVLDNRTSNICQELDGKRFKVKDKKVGVNCNPMHVNCRSTTRAYLGKEAEKTLERRARNPITGKNEIIDNMSYNDWLKHHNIIKEKNNKFTTSDNITYDTLSLRKLDNNLVNTTRTQLDTLLNKYPNIGEFIKDRGLEIRGKNINAIAITSYDVNMDNMKLSLSNNYYKDYKTHNKEIKNKIKDNWFMPCNNKSIDKYVINHEFGHIVENYLINDYNMNNIQEYNNLLIKLQNVKDKKQYKTIYKDYETKITDKIAQDIYDIALKNNKDFDLSKNLSRYGYDTSSEFFAEAFANLESGKPNELGQAIKEYLKGVL